MPRVEVAVDDAAALDEDRPARVGHGEGAVARPRLGARAPRAEGAAAEKAKTAAIRRTRCASSLSLPLEVCRGSAGCKDSRARTAHEPAQRPASGPPGRPLHSGGMSPFRKKSEPTPADPLPPAAPGAPAAGAAGPPEGPGGAPARPRRARGRDVPPEPVAGRPGARALRRGDGDRRPARRDRRAAARRRGHRALHRAAPPSCAARTSAPTAAACSTRTRPCPTTRSSRRPRRQTSGAAKRRLGRVARGVDVPPLRRRRASRPGATASSAACACRSRSGPLARLAAPAGSARLGWYPGDWIWLALLARSSRPAAPRRRCTLDRGHRAAAAVTHLRRAARRGSRPRRSIARRERPDALAAGTRRLDGRPRLRSRPAAGRETPAAAPPARPRHGLPQVGVLDSSAYASLHPGYYVVFSGVYGIPATRTRRSTTVRAAASPAPTSSASARRDRGLRQGSCYRKRKHL